MRREKEEDKECNLGGEVRGGGRNLRRGGKEGDEIWKGEEGDSYLM